MKKTTKINVGIIGYGNLGKAIEKNLLQNSSYNLVKIFSRRKLPNCEHISNLKNYENKIDLLFLCCGSKNELEKLAFKCINKFSIIDCYDNHNRLPQYITKLNNAANKSQKIALCAFGWDPGIFSLMRGLFDSIGFVPFTFWGKGLSQGHTQAIKNIENVIDGIQFTIPNKAIIKKLQKGENFSQSKKFNKRSCYVVCDKKNRSKIKQKIITMPDYFEGYKTTVKFVSQKRLNSLKNFAHQGIVTTKSNVLKFQLTAKSNPDITAKIMIAFATAYIKLKENKMYKAYTIFDLPLSYIFSQDKFCYL